MKYYDKYNLEDFLLDESFRLWVTQNTPGENKHWDEVAKEFPEKKIIIAQARDLLLTWNEHNFSLSEHQLEAQVHRILKSTDVPTQPKVRSFSGSGIWLSAAASLLIILGFGYVVFRNGSKETLSSVYQRYVPAQSPAMKEIVNDRKTLLKVNLPDGSVIKLSPAARISYAGQFIRNKKREVYLSGEAFFDVHKDAQNPFFVYANGLVTRVVGTSFLVRTTATNVEVLVRSGRVSVLAMKDMDRQGDRNTELLLTPNQQAIFSTKDNLISKSISSMPLELIKPESEAGFVFLDQPIHKVFATLEKVYGIPIVYDSAVMEKCSLRVELSNEPFFTKLDIISKTIGASYRVSDGQVIISSEGCD